MKKEASRPANAGSKYSQLFEKPALDVPAIPEGNKGGRPAGKLSDPTYGQFSFHLPRRVHNKFKSLCVEEQLEMSEEVEELILEWFRRRGKIE